MAPGGNVDCPSWQSLMWSLNNVGKTSNGQNWQLCHRFSMVKLILNSLNGQIESRAPDLI